MASGRFFEGASHMQLHGGQSFANANTIINKYYNYPAARAEPEPGLSSCRREDDQWLILRGGQRLRRIDMGDLLILREVSSEMLCVSVKLKSTNPFRNRMRGVVKIRKRIQSARIIPGFGDQRFSVVSLEPEDDGDVEKIWTVLEPIYEIALSRRRVWLTQLFGVGRSMVPTLIYHDEVVGGDTIFNQYNNKIVPVVFFYLAYRLVHSFIEVHDDGTLQKLSIPLSIESCDWTFNLRTLSFQYDLITMAPSDEDDPQVAYRDRLLPPPRDCNPPLDSVEIIRSLPNFLQIVSSGGDHCIRTKSFHYHDILTFGTVVDPTKPGVLAYFPSISTPVWSCEPCRYGTPDITPKCSKSVRSLVDLTFVKANDKWDMNIRFSLRLPPEDCRRLRNAYLVQSFPFFQDHVIDDLDDLVFFDELGLKLTGTFMFDPSSCDPPIYLHVPPLSTEWIDNMHCLRWPLKNRLFYWSFDRRGRMEIAQEEWARYRIPNLKVKTCLGSTWVEPEYEAVQEYLRCNNYDLGGQQFANDHGYPILVKGDPHIRRKSNFEARYLYHGYRGRRKMNMPIEGSSGKEGKSKQTAHKPNLQIDLEADPAGQAAIVEIPDR
ncbi:hypothetical protein E1B28_010586 [Marasmius oreades]|uniref:Uncharacterized protein n=1 Tax=Marasmius oreades TaxID=181124 RepID=A0A9P7RXJ4_9AGAR|nr:uncharacterized protein E1B28_010586 [Marasmius oreades]KAG7091559.1 hypothetical protein E1B28_010586 [Marasmius oreades]